MYEQQPPDSALSVMDKAVRLECTRAELLGGADAIWHYTASVSGNRVVSLAVICCPHRHKVGMPCPLPPT